MGVAAVIRPRLLATFPMPDAVTASFRQRFDLTVLDRITDPVALAGLCQGYDALVCTLANRVDAGFITALPASIRAIATYSVGVDHVDRLALAARGLPLINTPDVLTDATADIALLLLLGAARRAGEGERLLRAGHWTGWEPNQLLGTQVSGQTLGILGFGRIGQAVTRRAAGFGMAVHAHVRARPFTHEQDGVIFHPSLEAVLPHSRFLSLHLPLTEATRGWLNAERLVRLPRGAVVVNTARGALIDEPALAAALASGQVGAAGLDVFTDEPAINPLLLAAPNTFLLPHLGSATTETRTQMGLSLVHDLDAFFRGEIPRNLVTP